MKKIWKRTSLAFIAAFTLMNIIAATHAYKFTHYSTKGERTKSSGQTTLQKLALLFTGIDNPRPKNLELPAHPYTTVNIKSNVNIECWLIPALSAPRGTIILHHGYTSSKSQLLTRAEYFLRNGYNCMLVDFMGSGGSGGNSTTVGVKEAGEVKDCFQWLQQTGEKKIFLYGSSMGAVAIMNAISDFDIAPKAIIIECPFATMYQTVAIRFKNMGVPTFPMAHLLLFWGGVENGFWGYSHNPVVYAEKIKCPVLLQYGEKDDRVAPEETSAIFENLHCSKQRVNYPLAGHDDYIKKYPAEWESNTIQFLHANN
ncbi:MAG: alpha/beta hydrolase [Taibaiella sp.]|nr:alpha/beta hydrolase [Taibaiella sp.]